MEIRRKKKIIRIEIRLTKDIIIREWKYIIKIIASKVGGKEL